MTPPARPLTIGVIGGSNSILRDGYLGAMRTSLERDHGIDVAAIRNVAVGASTSFMGLIQILSTKVHMDVDVLLVEYALNDDGGLGNRPRNHERWAQAVEGILRRVLSDRPDILVCTVILGRRVGAWRKRACPSRP